MSSKAEYLPGLHPMKNWKCHLCGASGWSPSGSINGHYKFDDNHVVCGRKEDVDDIQKRLCWDKAP